MAIIAGSRGMSGAAVLCGLGALRGGAGLVRVYTAASAQPLLTTSEPCLMSAALPEDRDGRIDLRDIDEWVDELDDWDVVGIGPGLGRSEGIEHLLQRVVERFHDPLIIDADGLNNLAAGEPLAWDRRASKPLVITPHPGEIERVLKCLMLEPMLVNDSMHRNAAAQIVAQRIKAVVALKGHHTVVSDGQRVYVNTTGNPGMATGGMGDVLTGLIAALIGQGLPPFDATCLGVYVHGRAGDLAAERIGPVGFLAREVADLIPVALVEANRPRIGFHS